MSEIVTLRGTEVSREAVPDWEVKLMPVTGGVLRKRRFARRRGPGTSCCVDELYLKVCDRYDLPP